jgi:hypothetical protein
MVQGDFCLGRLGANREGVKSLEMPQNNQIVPWGQQVEESAPAFAAFVRYRDLGALLLLAGGVWLLGLGRYAEASQRED